MTCKISPETLMTLYEQALPWWHALFLKTHTPWCTSCQAQLTSFSTLDGQLRALAPIPVEIALAPVK